MHILLTNDDGLFAPGLAALYRSISSFGDVSVVAPAQGQSASGHSLTVRSALVCSRQQVDEQLTGWAVEGRPADCVKLAIRELLDAPPDLVVSGLNAGANVGINVIYSGTVAAAVEAAFFRIPALAFSLGLDSRHDQQQTAQCMQRASDVAAQILTQALDAGLVKGTVLNVNVPIGARPKGVRFVKQSTVGIDDHYQRSEDDQGRLCYTMSPDFKFNGPVPNTDVQALAEGFASVTPLHFDLTNHEQLQILSDNQWRITP
ncbi:MAG: 5'/3'-nucleotidase SurE [Actinobacteria bacterium]|nr:5'/3'-nucleotidase SurE [Actinomycetota bacterium]